MKLLTLLLFALALVTLDTSRRVRAQAVDCGDPRDIPIHHLLCQYAELEQRVAALEADKARLEQRMAEVSWQKAGDRIALWQQQSARYEDRWLLDLIWTRYQVHTCRAGIEHNGLVRCP